MGLYNFQKRFVPFILDGRKTHTIRATRMNPDKPGNMLHLYTGLRLRRVKGKSQAKLLMRVPCVKVEEIRITQPTPVAEQKLPHQLTIVEIDGNALDRAELEELAKRDGFCDFADMMSFWKGRLPFEGQIIHWKRRLVWRHKWQHRKRQRGARWRGRDTGTR